MIKKVFIAAMLLLICFAPKAWAYDFSDVCESGQTLYYKITSSAEPYTVEVVHGFGYDDDLTGNLIIPQYVAYDGKRYSVTSIGQAAFAMCSYLASVTIPNSVTIIDDNAFDYCSYLSSVTIPSSVTRIGDNAFDFCRRLTSVTLPNSVTRIGKEAFKSCEGLTKIVISNYVTSIGAGAFWGCGNLTSISVGKNNPNYDSRNNCNAIIETATNTLIYGCRNTTIPNSVTCIGPYAFAACKELKTMTIPNSVKSIGYGAFDGSEITSINIPNSVTSIGDYAFSYSGITSINIPNSVTSIGDWAFAGCSGLKEPVYNANIFIYLPNGYATDYTIPTGIRNIAIGAFSDCDSLKSIIIPNSITSIGSNTFCFESLESINIPNSVTSIGDSAFYDCERLKSVVIPGSVKSIGTNVFSSCDSIANITIKCDIDVSGADLHVIKDGIKYLVRDKKSVKIMSDYGYEDEKVPDPYSDPYNPDYYLERVMVKKCPKNPITTIPETINAGDTFTVTSIDSEAFELCSELTSVIIPNSVTEIGEGAFSGIRNIVYDGPATGSPWGAKMVNGYEDGFLLYSDETKTNMIDCDSHATNVIIPNSVTTIGDYAFYGCENLTSIDIPSSVMSIGDNAFTGCSNLTTVNFNATNCTYMGTLDYYVFADCPSLTTLNIGENVTNIPNFAFTSCSGLTSVTIPNSVTGIGFGAFALCSRLSNITIGNSVTKISDCAFMNCESLTSIKIPNSVTSIGKYAFSACSGLTSITIPKSVTSIEDSAFAECNKLDSKTVKKINKINPNAFKME